MKTYELLLVATVYAMITNNNALFDVTTVSLALLAALKLAQVWYRYQRAQAHEKEVDAEIEKFVDHLKAHVEARKEQSGAEPKITKLKKTTKKAK